MIDAVGKDEEASHRKLRRAMIESRAFRAAVFIGGMEGIHEEAKMFANRWPQARVLPVGTTGAAARELAAQPQFLSEFRTERTYPTLFRRWLVEA
jgi:hypothetical protein